MSVKHPIIAITGSSGAGTTSVTRTFENIFRREKVTAAIIEGDSFHRYDRLEMRKKAAEAEKQGDKNFSHFGPTTNLFSELETLFRTYGETGSGKRRKYLHDHEEAAPYKQEPGTFTPWEDVPAGTDLLFYEGLHGAVQVILCAEGGLAAVAIGGAASAFGHPVQLGVRRADLDVVDEHTGNPHLHAASA